MAWKGVRGTSWSSGHVLCVGGMAELHGICSCEHPSTEHVLCAFHCVSALPKQKGKGQECGSVEEHSRSARLARRNPGLASSTAEEWGSQQLLRNRRCHRMVLTSYRIQCTNPAGEVGQAWRQCMHEVQGTQCGRVAGCWATVWEKALKVRAGHTSYVKVMSHADADSNSSV